MVLPGALTPTEVIAAWKARSDFVKIFPLAPVGGVQYVRALKVPLPQIPLIATGGRQSGHGVRLHPSWRECDRRGHRIAAQGGVAASPGVSYP